MQTTHTKKKFLSGIRSMSSRQLGVLTIVLLVLAGTLSVVAGLRNPQALTAAFFYYAAAGFRWATL